MIRRYCWYEDIKQYGGAIVWWKSIRSLQYCTMEIVRDALHSLAASIGGLTYEYVLGNQYDTKYKYGYRTSWDAPNTVRWRSMRYRTCSSEYRTYDGDCSRYRTCSVYRWRSIRCRWTSQSLLSVVVVVVVVVVDLAIGDCINSISAIVPATKRVLLTTSTAISSVYSSTRVFMSAHSSVYICVVFMESIFKD